MITDALSLLLDLFPVSVALSPCKEGVPFVFAFQDGARVQVEGGASKRFDAGSVAMRHPSSTQAPWQFRHGGAKRLVAGHFIFDRPKENLLFTHLPQQALTNGEKLGGLAAVLNAEYQHNAPGKDVVLSCAASILFPLMVRAWQAQPRGLYALLADVELLPALHCMLSAPQVPWTLATLAKACSISRASFGRRFPLVANETPAALLARLRMAQAALLLREGHLSIPDISRAVGYQSVSSFHRKFKALIGTAPRQYRRESQYESLRALD